MSKYIDADRLCAEIIRLRKERPFHDDASFLAYLHGLSKIEDFIVSLQQEQPCEDFEKEWDEFENWMESYITSDYPTYYGPKQIARHFYILGLKNNIPVTQITLDELAKEGEPINEDLEEAAENIYKVPFGTRAEDFIAGAVWQKSQDESRRMANIQLANTDTPVDTEMEVAFNDIWRDAEVIVERDGTLDEKATELMKAVCHDFFESGKEWQKERMPKWKKNGGLLRFAILEDENGRYVQHEGYKIYFNDLLKLPKED